MESQGFEPRMPEATDLQSAEVTNASRSPIFGRGTENRTLVNRLKAYYFATKLYLHLFSVIVQI